MAELRNLAKVNPCSPIFYLKIGDTEVTKANSIYAADNFISFSMKLTALDVASDIEIVVYDDSALAFEYEILRGYQNVQFKFGQDLNNMSKMYSATITDYDLEFVNLGVQLTLKLILGATGATSEESKSYKGTPSDIVKKICKEEDWEVGKITACKSNTKDTFTRSGKTAVDFITQDLIPKAVSTKGKTNYTFYTTSKDGKTVANFTTQKATTDENNTLTDYTLYEIVIGKDHEAVIDFKPSFSGLMYNLLGGVAPNTGNNSGNNTTGNNGTNGNTGTSQPLQPGETHKAEITAYWPSNEGVEGGYDQSAGGKLNPDNLTCAAPSCIPFYTKIQISGTGTSQDGKVYTVTDRGGAIVVDPDGTYHIDLLMHNRSEVNTFGRRKAQITILSGSSSTSSKNNSSSKRSSKSMLMAYSRVTSRDKEYTASGEPINGNDSTINNTTSPNTNDNNYSLNSNIQVVAPAIDKLTNNLITASTDTKVIKRRVGTSSYNSKELGELAEYLFTRSVMLSNSAELTVRGDASIQPQSFVAIMVLTKDGFFHHSSGLYQVLEVSHDLDMGNFTTTLNMFRRGMQIGEDGSITLLDPGNSTFSSNLADKMNGGNGSTPGNSGTSSGGGGITGDFVTSDEIIKQFDSKFKGMPYSLGAKGAYGTTSAYDCSGFACAMIKELAKAHGGDTRIDIGGTQSMIVDYKNYSVGWDKSKLQPGDLIIGVAANQTKVNRHVVMYVGNGIVCHAGSPLKYTPLDDASIWDRLGKMENHAVIRILAAKNIYTKVPPDWQNKVH